MKRFFIIFFMIMVISLIPGCIEEDPDNPQVRFYNNSVDILFNYGLKYGYAEYRGELDVGDVTKFFETEPGSYEVFLLTEAGNWDVETDLIGPVEEEKRYTIEITGTFGVDTTYTILEYE